MNKEGFLAICEVEWWDETNDQTLVDCIVLTDMKDYAEVGQRVQEHYGEVLVSLKTTLIDGPFLPITSEDKELLLNGGNK